MIFLDITYFQGEEGLPNLVNSPSVTGVSSFLQTVGEHNLNWFIAKYEPDFMIKILGKELYKNFIDGLDETPVNPIWEKLRDSLFWREGVFKFSPAANYVYYWLRRSGRKQTATQGEVIGTLSYANNAEDAEKMIQAWNDMCDMIVDFRCFFCENREAYQAYAKCFPDLSYFRKINSFDI